MPSHDDEHEEFIMKEATNDLASFIYSLNLVSKKMLLKNIAIGRRGDC